MELTAIPLQIVRGTSLDYRRTYADFPASAGWTAKLWLAGASVVGIDGVADGDSFDFSLTVAQTTALAAGVYLWEERVIRSPEEKVAADGTVGILETAKNAAAGALVSFEAKLLAAVEAAIFLRTGVGLATPIDILDAYQVHRRQVTKMSLRELMTLRADLKRSVRNQMFPGRMGPSVLVTFTGVQNENNPSPWSE